MVQRPTARPLHTAACRQSYSLSSPHFPFLRCVHMSVLQVKALFRLQTELLNYFPRFRTRAFIHAVFSSTSLFEGVALACGLSLAFSSLIPCLDSSQVSVALWEDGDPGG